MKIKNIYFLNLVLLLLILILILVIIVKLNYIEKFTIKNEVKNIFDTKIFDNKEVFLIANNPNISEKTRKFLDNYDTSNSIVVRFNLGMQKEGVKDLIRGKTDIIVYRKCEGGFHGYSKKKYIENKNNVISVFTTCTKNNKNIPLSNYFNKNKNFINDLPDEYPFDIEDKNRFLMVVRMWDDEHYNPGPKKKKSMTTGFNFLFELFQKINKIKKIYLIGYTFHNKGNYLHDEKIQNEYFNKHMSTNKKIQIML